MPSTLKLLHQAQMATPLIPEALSSDAQITVSVLFVSHIWLLLPSNKWLVLLNHATQIEYYTITQKKLFLIPNRIKATP